MVLKGAVFLFLATEIRLLGSVEKKASFKIQNCSDRLSGGFSSVSVFVTALSLCLSKQAMSRNACEDT